MSWHERMNRAIDYIESNLCDGIDLECIAKITCQSATSFQRTFSIVTGMPVSGYIRRRRMGLAAFDLKDSKAKVIDISLKYGYDSPEAFARAFKEIYGISPSAARKEGVSLKVFPRISFLLTIKGDVVMDYIIESDAVKIVNMYYEHFPALRLIGKRYTSADFDADMKLGSKWNEWYQKGWFSLLIDLGCLKGHESTGIFGIHKANETAYWIGMFFAADTSVPEGFDYADIPAGDVGMCWIYGYRDNGQLFSQSAHDLCLAKLQDAGNAVKMDFGGVPSKWSFERYDSERFNIPDSDGKVILDYGIYIVESERNQREPLNADQAEGFGQRRRNTALSGGDMSFVKGTPLQELSTTTLLTGIAPYSVDVESNLFFCALATVILKLENRDETTPFFCARQGGICSHCGACGDMGKRSNLAKHHLNMYHHLLTTTGVGLMWGDLNETGEYNLKYMKGIVPSFIEDRLDFAMKSWGFDYIAMDKMKGERELSRQIMAAIRNGMPVLIKLSDGAEWCVVTGFDEEAGAICGLDAKKHFRCNSAVVKSGYNEDGLFIMTDWFKHVRKMVIVTGKYADSTDFNSLLERMAGRLSSPELGVLESTIPRMIDAVTVDNARGVAGYLNDLAGYAAEARWHAAECFDSLRYKTDDERVRTLLCDCRGLYFNTHDTCWEIWGQLGVGPHTNFKLPNLINPMMLDKDRQTNLKDLFARIVHNDRSVRENLLAVLSEP